MENVFVEIIQFFPLLSYIIHYNYKSAGRRTQIRFQWNQIIHYKALFILYTYNSLRKIRGLHSVKYICCVTKKVKRRIFSMKISITQMCKKIKLQLTMLFNVVHIHTYSRSYSSLICTN